MTEREKEEALPEDEQSGFSADPEESSELDPDTQPRPYPDIVDDTLDDSFPASDPPGWAGS